MRRQTLISGLNRIHNDLNQSGLFEFLEEPGRAPASDSIADGLRALNTYSKTTSKYSVDEEQMLKLLNLHGFTDSDIWQQLLFKDGGKEGEAINEIRTLKALVETIPLFTALLKNNDLGKYVEKFCSEGEKIRHMNADDGEVKSLLSIIIAEDEQEFSSPGRVIRALQSITDLYHVHSIINGTSESDLIILSCDSGGDKSFDFLGLAETIKQVKLTIEAIWDRVLFSRDRSTTDEMKLFAESLPVNQKIDSMARDESISREQAELLKRKLYSGTRHFLNAGVVTPELDSISRKNPKQIMKPKQNLLVAPMLADSSDVNQTQASEMNHAGSAEEYEKYYRNSKHSKSLEELEKLEKGGESFKDIPTLINNRDPNT